jgi:hypothetical protein
MRRYIADRPNAKVPVMKSRYTISLTCVLKTKYHLDDPIVLCMIVGLIVYSAYHYSLFAFGLYVNIFEQSNLYIFQNDLKWGKHFTI